MSDFFSTIGNALGGLVGIPQGQQADKANKQSQAQQALQNQYGHQAAGIYDTLLQNGNNFFGEYAPKAGAAYSQVSNQGDRQLESYNQNYLPLLNQYAAQSGLGADTLQGVSPTDQSKANPYGLSENQQSLLNQSQAQIANAKKSAYASAQQELSANGITDPRSLSLINQQLDMRFSSLQAETQAKFYEQVKNDKLAALKEVLSSIEGYGNQALQEKLAGAQGFSSLGQMGLGAQEAAGAGYQGLAGGAQSASNAQQNYALAQQQNQQESLGGLLNLIGFGAGGGFGSPRTQSVSQPIIPYNGPNYGPAQDASTGGVPILGSILGLNGGL